LALGAVTHHLRRRILAPDHRRAEYPYWKSRWFFRQCAVAFQFLNGLCGASSRQVYAQGRSMEDRPCVRLNSSPFPRESGQRGTFLRLKPPLSYESECPFE